MASVRRYRPSAAMVVATTALLVALGGGAYAAFKVPKNSIGPEQLQNGAVTNRKIKNGAVTGAKIADGSITGTQIDASTVGLVPNASHAGRADTATNAQHASSADTAANAQHASSADTAANAQQLGGQSASAYEQGSGRVMTAQLSGVGSSYQVLLDDGSIQVRVGVFPALTGANVEVINETASQLTFTQDGSSPGAGTIAANGGTSGGFYVASSNQIRFQVWNAATPSRVWTINVSGLPTGGIFAGEMTVGAA